MYYIPGCITKGDDLEEVLYMAKDALELHLYGTESDGDPIPKATAPAKIESPQNGFVTLIQVWMPPIRDEMAKKSDKKTLKFTFFKQS